MFRSLYTATDKALAHPARKEWVSTRSIGIPFSDGYSSAPAANFTAALMFLAETYVRLPPIQNDDR